MIPRTYSATLLGVNAVEVEIESCEANSLQFRMNIVGLPDTAIKESRDRVLSAIRSSGFAPPKQGTITVNLAPASLRKEGPGFDLPIAVALVARAENLAPEALRECCLVGELALNGEVRPIKGVLAIALEARRQGRSKLIVPKSAAIQASVVHGIDVIGIHELRDVIEYLQGWKHIEPEPCRAAEFFASHSEYSMDYNEVKGQNEAKRGLEIAAAGGHNLLMIGPPGTGKSMLAKRLPTIMPPMSELEAIETTKIHSVSGLLDESRAFIATRPFRAPHHTISDAGLLGGGSHPGPGEVSLAHHGVLFLDELPEFRRSTLEVMRQPLEDAKVTITRATATVTFPSRFMLIAAMNPCPCGYYGDPKRACQCSPLMILRYRQRISGPLLDRIDLHVEVPAIDYKLLSSKQLSENSANIRQRVESARQIQTERFAKEKDARTNSAMAPRLMRKYCQLDAESSAHLEHAMNHLNLSARAHDRILKVSRTLADLEASVQIKAHHLLEAINYRTLDRQQGT